MKAFNRDVLIFDIEVFKEDFLFVAYHTEKQTYLIVHNDPQGMRNFWDTYKDQIWVGYNSRNYDIPVIQNYMCYNTHDQAIWHAKEISDKIISSHGNEEERYRPPKQAAKIYPIINYDCMVDVQAQAASFGVSLKKLEAYLGFRIEETHVDFNIDRKLTDSEFSETLYYCKWDVKCTYRVFEEINKLSGDFQSHIGLIEMFNLPILNVNRTKAQISAFILNARKPETPRDDEFNFTFPDTLKLEKYDYIREWYANPSHRSYDQRLITNVAGIKHIYAWGGLHAARPNYKEDGCFLMCDVGSFYPSLMIEYGYLSRNVSDPLKFKEIYDTRMEYKKNHDPRANSLKIVINATFGALKDQHNELFDAVNSNNVCVGGMLLLTDLIEKLESITNLVQSNTDGILIRCERRDKDEVLDIAHEWEKRTRMNLSFDEYAKVIQRDVNNYLIVDVDGHIKAKGTDVKDRTPIDYECAAICSAMREYFINDVPVAKTIWDDDNYMDFMMVVKSSVKFDGLCHYRGKTPYRLNENTVRVFASSDLMDGAVMKIPKVVESVKKTQSALTDWGFCDPSYEAIPRRNSKIAKLPQHCFIDNGTIIDKPIPNKLDKNWYVLEAERRIKQWGIPT